MRAARLSRRLLLLSGCKDTVFSGKQEKNRRKGQEPLRCKQLLHIIPKHLRSALMWTNDHISVEKPSLVNPYDAETDIRISC